MDEASTEASTEVSTGIGLNNIRQRLMLFYGDDADFTIAQQQLLVLATVSILLSKIRSTD